MRLSISTQPISTRRSPRSGSRPVVSVSRTISRMIQEAVSGGESGSPLRHLNNLGQDVRDLGTHWVESVRRIHHEIGTLALFRVGCLLGDDGVELRLVH